MPVEFCSLRRFQSLSLYQKLRFLHDHATPLKINYQAASTEADLYCYSDYYIELIAESRTNEVLRVNAFRSLKKLMPYLSQIDIGEITVLLSCH